MKQGGLMKKMEGSWTVGPSKAIPGGVCVMHTLTIKMALAPPPLFGATRLNVHVQMFMFMLGCSPCRPSWRLSPSTTHSMVIFFYDSTPD
jgi:hypothetical protein